MSPNNRDALFASLKAMPTLDEQKQFLAQNRSHLDDALAEMIKREADIHVRDDARRAIDFAYLLYHSADLTNNLHHRGLGLFAEANACSFGGLGQYQRAIDLCDEAATIYGDRGQPIIEADAQITKIYALTMLGALDEALRIGDSAAEVLEAHREWARLVPLTINIALVHGRLGKDSESLRLLDRAAELCTYIPKEQDAFLAGIAMNRALVLRNLGRFNESLEANQQACHMLERLGQRAEVGHAQQILAYTNFMLGRYNVALQILLETKMLFESLERRPELLETELYICECYLQLRRFGPIVKTIQEVKDEAEALGLTHEFSATCIIETAAHMGSGAFEKAQSILQTQLEKAKSSPILEQATIQLQLADVLFTSSQWQESFAHAKMARQLFTQMEREVESAYASMAMGKAAAQLSQVEASDYAHEALSVGKRNGLSPLIYHAYRLLGALTEISGDHPGALGFYHQAANELEKISSQTMLEHRAQFMTDKSTVYEEMVRLNLLAGRRELALETIQRAKSRALLTLLAHRVNLSLHSRDDADRPLIHELTTLCAERDRLVHRLEDEIGFSQYIDSQTKVNTNIPSSELQAIEEQITDRWHALLIRNADYADQAALWLVQVEPIRPLLDHDTLLLEYFIIQDTFVLFAVTKEQIEVFHLPCPIARLQRMAEALRLNLRMAPQSASTQLVGLVESVQNILSALYQQLVEPASDLIRSKERLVIVPYDLLHYLPFHAFYTKTSGYLLDQIEISYLPASPLLRTIGVGPNAELALSNEPTRLATQVHDSQAKVASFGHAYQGQLPFAVEEAQSVANITGGIAYLDEAASRENFRRAAADASILHLATHGHFRADDPLFSGLALADGWQTTFDTFNLQTNASLVTLSACQTGRSVVGGGDELLGLTRSFLAAGAKSLVLSQWTVEDQSTSMLMTHFYRRLMAGWSKAAALNDAQRSLRNNAQYAHPYFWAAFSLVGANGPITSSID